MIPTAPLSGSPAEAAAAADVVVLRGAADCVALPGTDVVAADDLALLAVLVRLAAPLLPLPPLAVLGAIALAPPMFLMSVKGSWPRLVAQQPR